MAMNVNTQNTQWSDMQTQNGERLGTFILMSPILMLRGISGRFIFFTAETARAGAADRPPCQKHTHKNILLLLLTSQFEFFHERSYWIHSALNWSPNLAYEQYSVTNLISPEKYFRLNLPQNKTQSYVIKTTWPCLTSTELLNTAVCCQSSKYGRVYEPPPSRFFGL